MNTRIPRRGSLDRPEVDPATIKEDPRVVCPIRVSTDHQVYGLKAQLAPLRQHAERNDLQIAGVFEDKISAKESPFLHRPGVHDMLRFMARTGIRRILITKVDRAFRQLDDFLQTCRIFQEKRILLTVADLGLDAGTPHGQLVIGILAQLGEWELAMRSGRQLDAFEEMRNRRLPCSGVIRYGWEPDPDAADGRLRPVAFEQEMLREINELYHQAEMSYHEIAAHLEERGIPKTFRRYRIDPDTKARHLVTRDSTWTWKGIRSILEHSELAPECHPDLVS